MNALDCAAIAAGWLLIACAMGSKLGRAMKRADPGEDCEENEAPLLAPQPTNDWMALVSADCLRDGDPLISERFFALVEGESWFGGVLNDPRHLKGDVA